MREKIEMQMDSSMTKRSVASCRPVVPTSSVRGSSTPGMLRRAAVATAAAAASGERLVRRRGSGVALAEAAAAAELSSADLQAAAQAAGVTPFGEPVGPA